MANMAREALAKEIWRWRKDPNERIWLSENPKASLFQVCARMADWLRIEAIRTVSSGSEDYGGIANKLVSMWLMNLGSWLKAYDLCAGIIQEETLLASDAIVSWALEEKMRTGRRIGDIIRERKETEP